MAAATSNVRIFDMAAVDYRAEDERTRQFKGSSRTDACSAPRACAPRPPARPTSGPRGLSSHRPRPRCASQVRTPPPVRLFSWERRRHALRSGMDGLTPSPSPPFCLKDNQTFIFHLVTLQPFFFYSIPKTLGGLCLNDWLV